MRRRLLAFLIFLSCNSLAAFAQNLITNPEFAGNLAGWNIYNHTQAVYDPTLNAPGSLGGSVKIINDVDESSNPACNANPTTICVTPFPIDQYVPVTPGVLYAFGGKVFIPSGQSASGAGEVAISFWDTNGKPINIGHLGSGNSVTSIGVWVSSDGTVQAPVGAVRVRLVPNNGRVGPTGSLQVNFDEMFFQPAATRLQVLIVPGILGTKLANNSEVVWMSNATLNSAALLGNPFNDLAYDTNGHPVDASLTTSAMTSTGDYGELFNLFSDTGVAAYALDCNTVLERINKTLTSLFGGASNCEKQINIYNSLASILSGGYAVQLFPYDWRRDIGDLSEDLFAKVQTMSGGSQVAIVAHSMGGLIVQEMMHRHAPALTNVLGPIITLGTPFLGSVDTYLYFQGWKDFLPWVVDGYTMSQIGKNWTSSYELLPRWNGFVQLGGQQIPYSQVYSGQSLPPWAYALPRQSALPIAYNLWAESPPTSLPNAYAIVGSGFATGLQINDNDETGCAELLHGNGDGTVPLISARGSSWISPNNVWYVNEQHIGLPSNLAVIHAVVVILQGGTPTNLLASPTPMTATTTSLCSPVQVTATNSEGQVEGPNSGEITGGQYFTMGKSSEVVVPIGDTYTLQLTGTGTGTFTAIVKQVDQDGNTLQKNIFSNVPVKPVSQGTLQVSDAGVGMLSFDYNGKGVVDSIPANFTPPTIQCTGCYFTIQNLRATLAFNIGYQGAVSTFSYNYRSATQTVQFASTTTSQISVNGNTSTFSGQGALNGNVGYNFTVTAKDGGGVGSGLDTFSVAITGPNNYSYSVNGTIAGGDIVVHQ